MDRVYEATLSAPGNPDFGQYAPVAPREKVQASSIKGLWAKCEEYIEKFDLGGGNWADPKVKEDGKGIGHFSYNGRLWSAGKSAVNANGCEIVY
jgi:hypothetical protein